MLKAFVNDIILHPCADRVVFSTRASSIVTVDLVDISLVDIRYIQVEILVRNLLQKKHLSRVVFSTAFNIALKILKQLLEYFPDL